MRGNENGGCAIWGGSAWWGEHAVVGVLGVWKKLVRRRGEGGRTTARGNWKRAGGLEAARELEGGEVGREKRAVPRGLRRSRV